ILTRPELRELLQLSLPVVVVQVGIMTMGVVDVIMVGHVSAAALASVALGNLYVFGLSAFGMGALLALDPVIAQAVGARNDAGVSRGLQRGLVLCALLAAGTSLLLLPAAPVMRALKQPAVIVPEAAAYARIAIPGILPFFAFIVLRQTLQAMGRLRPIVLSILVANMANVGLNWVFIYGKLGSPALGVAGASIATSLSRMLMALMLLALAWKLVRPHLWPVRAEVRQLAPLVRMIRLGVPIGAQFQLEFGAFAVIAVLMGWLGPIAMAGHQVAINLAAFTYMVPLGVSAAAAVLVGRAVGRGDAESARRFAQSAVFCGVGFMALTGILFLAMPGVLARIYTADAQVIALSATLIPLAGLFQIFDGLQVVATGVLRGAGDTRAPMVVNVLGFWLAGMPISVYFGLHTAAGPRGLWWGLVTGLATVALILLFRVRHRLRGDVRALLIDDDAHAESRTARGVRVAGVAEGEA
ncbi:MAG TPA: MATE family efflux transporter, partial [Gemmatimonadaceae bacterium]|nr:MATE family efflux transporter [Gemmatimonadaceae bacterium]